MCTITLSYDNTNIQAREKLAALLASGMFEKITIEPSPSSEEILKEAHQRVMQKEYYTLEEACDLTLKEITSVYQMEYAL